MPTPTATIFVPYHALDDLILRGTRAAQPLASAVVAGTLYGVTDEGNAVERSTGAVWQAYSPTGGPGGAPAPHHATHEPGGTDPMAVDAVAATGSLRTLGSGAQQAAPGNDARFGAPTTPTAHHVSHEPGGADALVNAAWTTQPNVFTQAQTLSGPPAGDSAVRLKLIDTSQPADARQFQLQIVNQRLQVATLNDLETVGNPVFWLDRAGNVTIAQDVYEKNRLTPMGHWVAYAVTWAGSGGGGTLGNGSLFGNQMLIGKTQFFVITLILGTTTVVPAGIWYFTLPSTPATAARTGLGTAFMGDAGVADYNGWAVTYSGNTVMAMTAAGAYVSPTAPMTWGVNDGLSLSGWYVLP